MTKSVDVSPTVLRWARETAGLTIEEAARKLQVNGARGVSAADRLAAYEDGNIRPNRSLLLRMTKQYRRPLIAFYLATPPPKASRGEDFRRLPANYTGADDAVVDALVRDVRARQSIVRAALEDEQGTTALPFIASMRIEKGVERVVASIKQRLAFDLNVFRSAGTITEAFAYLRAQAEAVGIFVLIVSDLGSHHTRLSVEAFRGFALADPVAPFVIVNDQDARAAWAFTLLHEIVHLWLGQTGISGAIADTLIEKFCNDVAGTLLLPANELAALDVSDTTAFEDTVAHIEAFATARKISRSMVAYKLFRAGLINQDTWSQLQVKFRQQWYDYQQQPRDDDDGGPSYYIVKRYRSGKALIDLVSRLVESGNLTPTKAGKVLGIKPSNVYQLLQQPK